MKWVVTVATERELEMQSENINDAVTIANENKLPEESIVRIRLKREKIKEKQK